MRITSFNANGLRSAASKGFFDWVAGHGWVDAYRALHPQGQDYTWWSNRGAARAKDVGWRIDYQFATPALGKRAQACSICREPRFSDHAPFTVDYAE